MAPWNNWLANESPPWVAYHSIMAVRLVALEKIPGVRPLGIREVYRRLITMIFLQARGAQAKESCGSVKLCVSLEAGI